MTVGIGCHSHEEEKIILGMRLASFCMGNIVDDVTVIRSFSVSQSAVCSLQMSDTIQKQQKSGYRQVVYLCCAL